MGTSRAVKHQGCVPTLPSNGGLGAEALTVLYLPTCSLYLPHWGVDFGAGMFIVLLMLQRPPASREQMIDELACAGEEALVRAPFFFS